MSHQLQTLVKMINQIADNTPASGDEEKDAAAVAAHVQKFWAKPMKQQIRQYQESDGGDLNPLAAKAVSQL